MFSIQRQVAASDYACQLRPAGVCPGWYAVGDQAQAFSEMVTERFRPCIALIHIDEVVEALLGKGRALAEKLVNQLEAFKEKYLPGTDS